MFLTVSDGIVHEFAGIRIQVALFVYDVKHPFDGNILDVDDF